MADSPDRAGNGPEPDMALAERLFASLDAKTRKGRGIVRESYGPGEQAAHDLVRAAAEDLGLKVAVDAAANLYATLPGIDPEAPAIIIGSHLDSVPQGGNFDGAAGVVAGLAVLSAMRRENARPRCDITVMAVRAEEAAWFDASYVGSRAAFGKLPAAALDVPRPDTGRALADYMAEAGCDLDALRGGRAYLTPRRVRAYLEVHIEQAPVLEIEELPLGIVTGIRGILRYRSARCVGVYGHSGALPRKYRHDAVAATAALIQGMNEEWVRLEEQGRDLVFTVGELMTDPTYHGPSKVAGETRFVLDIRSLQKEIMTRMSERAESLAEKIERVLGVRFELGEPGTAEPAILDAGVRATLGMLAAGLRIPAKEMPSGAGHDAAVFANMGVPSGMIFIRNAHGSHNPDEEMEMADFQLAARLLSAYVVREVC